MRNSKIATLSSLLPALALVGACVTPKPQLPKPPIVPSSQICIDIWQQELGRMIDDAGLQDCLRQQLDGRTGDEIRARVKTSPEWAEHHAPPPPAQFVPLAPITVDGTIFRVNGQPWVLKGVTAFRLMDRFLKGEDIQPFLDAYRGFNTLFVFCYTPANVWGAASWESPSPVQVLGFVKEMNLRGWYVEITLLTNKPDAARLDSARAILHMLAAARTASASNVLIRLGNEPAEQNGAGNPVYTTTELKSAAEASGFVYDSGFYEANGSTWFGKYISPHTKRDAEWPRRGHDCFDITHGAVDAPALGKKPVPCVLGEPEKAGNATADDYEAYCGTGVQFGVGCALHSETGKQARVPTAAEAAVARGALRGLNAFPGNTNTGAYRRIDGDGLRTYIVGKTMVRIRPNTPNPPLPGYRNIDGSRILWMTP